MQYSTFIQFLSIVISWLLFYLGLKFLINPIDDLIFIAIGNCRKAKYHRVILAIMYMISFNAIFQYIYDLISK